MVFCIIFGVIKIINFVLFVELLFVLKRCFNIGIVLKNGIDEVLLDLVLLIKLFNIIVCLLLVIIFVFNVCLKNVGVLFELFVLDIFEIFWLIVIIIVFWVLIVGVIVKLIFVWWYLIVVVCFLVLLSGLFVVLFMVGILLFMLILVEMLLCINNVGWDNIFIKLFVWDKLIFILFGSLIIE